MARRNSLQSSIGASDAHQSNLGDTGSHISGDRISSRLVGAGFSRSLAIWSTISCVLTWVDNRRCCCIWSIVQAASLHRCFIWFMSVIQLEPRIPDSSCAYDFPGNPILAMAHVGGMENSTELVDFAFERKHKAAMHRGAT